MNTSAKHPNGLTVLFDEANHIYKVKETGQILTSATTFIGDFFPKFNTEEIANNVAEKYGITPKELIKKWNDKKENACEVGTNVHLFAEMLIKGDQLPSAKSPRERKLFNQVSRAVVALLKRFTFIETEKIVFSPVLGIAGTIDLLMADYVSKDLIIIDWKQNEDIAIDNVWQKGLPPIEHLDACELHKYSLQLNLYQYILKQEKYYPEFNGFKRVLIHLQESGFHGINVDDAQREIIDLVYYGI